MEEIWKDITLIPYHQAAWPFHQISNHGRVRVLPGGKIGNRTVIEIEIRKLTYPHTGYVTVSHGNQWLAVHHLVLNAFRGPSPPGWECRHLNGDRSDNRLENLKWGTCKENKEDQVRHRTIVRGEKHYLSKLTQAQILEIENRPYDDSCAKLAKEYSVSKNTIWRIRNKLDRYAERDDFKSSEPVASWPPPLSSA